MGSINDTDAKKRLRARSGHSQRASAKPTAEADKATTKKEQGMERVSDSNRASNWGTNARKVTDPRRGRTKQRGKNSRRLAAAGRITASAPAAPGCQENRQAEAEASPEGEVSKPKRQPADRRQSRWTWKWTYSQGSTMERTKNLPRPAASVRTTWKEGASGCRAQSCATDRGTNPSRQKGGQGTKDNPRPVARVVEATLSPNMGQWRTLEGAKDNLSSRTQRGPPGDTPWGTGRAETPQTEVWGSTMNWPVYLTQKGTLNLRFDWGQTNLDPAGVTPSRG